MPTDPYAKTRYRAARQADEDLRRDEPWLWHFANIVTWVVHPWVSPRFLWIERSLRLSRPYPKPAKSKGKAQSTTSTPLHPPTCSR